MREREVRMALQGSPSLPYPTLPYPHTHLPTIPLTHNPLRLAPHAHPDRINLIHPGAAAQVGHNTHNPAKILWGRKFRGQLLCMMMTWFGFGFLYYGLVFLTTRLFSDGGGGEADTKGGIDISSIAINSLSELVGTSLVYFTIDKTGRRTAQLVAYSLTSVFLLLLPYVGSGAALTILTCLTRIGERERDIYFKGDRI